jgi:hypothetical protein
MERKEGDIWSIEHLSSSKYFPDRFEEFRLAVEFFKRVSEFISIPEEVTDLRCIVTVKELIQSREEVCILEWEHGAHRVRVVLAGNLEPEFFGAPECPITSFYLSSFELNFARDEGNTWINDSIFKRPMEVILDTWELAEFSTLTSSPLSKYKYAGWRLCVESLVGNLSLLVGRLEDGLDNSSNLCDLGSFITEESMREGRVPIMLDIVDHMCEHSSKCPWESERVSTRRLREYIENNAFFLEGLTQIASKVK